MQMNGFGIVFSLIGVSLLWTGWRDYRDGKYVDSRFYSGLGTVSIIGGLGVLIVSLP